MEVYKLTGETVDLLSEKIGAMYKGAGCTKKETLRAKLLLEEALLKYQSRFGEDVELTFRAYRIFGQYRFCVRLRAASFDPFTLEENPMAFMIRNILSGFEDGMPTWKYRNLENEIVFTVRKKAVIGNLTKILIGVAVFLLCGILAKLFVPAASLSAFVGNYITPLSDAYAGLFCVMAVLLTVFAVLLSIVHIGDMASVGALGGRIMRRFFTAAAVSAIVLTLPILPLFDLTGSTAGAFGGAAKSVYDILIGFIPSNLVSPFLNFNSVHIMIVGAMFGFSLLAMGQKGSALTEIFEECNLVAVYTNNFLNKFIFLYVGLKVFEIVTTSDFAMLAGAGKMVAAIVIGELILFIFYTVYAHFKTGMPVAKLARTISPASLVCLSSANFGAAFSCIFDALFATDTDADTVSLSVNLGFVFFQPACTLVFVFSSLFMADAFGVEISAVWIIEAILLSIILVGSMPNVPGASVSVITLLYAQLGIPAGGIALMIAINAILQFLTVAVDVWCLQCEILCLGKAQKAK